MNCAFLNANSVNGPPKIGGGQIIKIKICLIRESGYDRFIFTTKSTAILTTSLTIIILTGIFVGS